MMVDIYDDMWDKDRTSDGSDIINNCLEIEKWYLGLYPHFVINPEIFDTLEMTDEDYLIYKLKFL